MNGTAAQIEILAPFGAAFEWMKAMLFRPFDLVRWLTIAFAAFISGSWGSGANFRWKQWSRGDWSYRFHRHGDFSDGSIPAWLIALIVVGVLLAIVLAFVWLWVTARGRFIFTDCIVKNRAAIAEPWREFRREGNSYFLYSIVVGFGIAFLAAVFIMVIVLPLGLFSDNHDAAINFGLALVPLISFGFIFVLLIVLVALISHLMVPVMYRRRCLAREAFVDVTRLIFHNPAPFALFVLFMIALAIGLALVGTVVMCATCCIGGLPYINTVLLLPAIVWLAAYRLLFLRQFGDQYDVWATGGFSAPATQSSVPPPVAPAG
ncbi:MAG: hypothetical protein M3N48_12220 [Verrucomicrobiota bacterium]|nr:hypothetical protein [Verrucomicrobiota bacterium]